MKHKPVGRLLLIAVAAIAAVLGAAGTVAGDDRLPAARNMKARTVIVNYADLDLSKEAGIVTLYRRLNTAARQVCGNRDLRRLEEVKDWKRCNKTALEGAIDQVGNARLTALHEEKAGIRKQPLVPVAGLP
ncbi:MAG: UrcA family protein [Gammaproteobacteria bacterium]|nr:UrcA family protein [Gammaproteobacteria bacterium]